MRRGSLAIGSGNAKVSLCNNIGDGTYHVYVGSEKLSHERWSFVGAVEGEDIKVFDYDCYHTAAEAEQHVLVTLSGRYGIWVEKSGGDFWLQKWE